MNTLFVIPARGGSKGIPKKNIKKLDGKPLITYAIDIARKLTSDENICVSTDSDEIIEVVENYGLTVPFKRPDELATDKSGSYDFMKHALHFYEKQGKYYDTMVLLQPTSPFRRIEDVMSCINKYESGNYGMVVSVCQSKTNPYYNCFEIDDEGFLQKIFESDAARRQDAKKVYEYNGACYVIKAAELRQHSLSEFQHIGFYEMDELHSIDLDTILDWKFAEFIIKEKLL